MNKTVLSIIIAVLLVGVAGIVIANNNNDTPETTTVEQSTTTESDDTDTTQNETPTTQQEESAAQTSAVEIANSAYSPSTVSVKKGSTVTWTNRDEIQHDVSPDSPTDEFKKSELLSQGETYSVTFNTPGTYSYHCTPHPFMTGTVVVTE